MRLLLVCLGNICRSPMAEGALRARIEASPLKGRVQVDSAGTGGWHAGQPPDPRAIACARGHGVDIATLRARRIDAEDFSRFDWILCADRDNLHDVGRRAPPAARQRLALWLPWAGVAGAEDLADPYTGGARQFEQVWERVQQAAAGTVQRLSRAMASGIIDA